MKAIIVNCFDTYHDRVSQVSEFFSKQGFNVNVIQSDFKHIHKTKITHYLDNYTYIETRPYFKNLSFKRLYSHHLFAKKAFEVVEQLDGDIIYVLLPPNSLAKEGAKYKQKYTNKKLIFDVIDLWPETMPIRKIKNIFPFSLWGKLRNDSLKYADFVITECNLFEEVLMDYLTEINHDTVHLASKKKSILNEFISNQENIQLCYLGSINNIIDIPLIGEIIREIVKYKPVTLHVIGGGESQEILFKEIKESGAVLNYHGKIYDDFEKQKIFDQCHLGLNIMKESVCVGLTMKSIDYFSGNLPIINNIKGDTQFFVEKYEIGLNVERNNISNLAHQIVSFTDSDYNRMKKNLFSVYNSYFYIECFEVKMKGIIKSVIESYREV